MLNLASCLRDFPGHLSGMVCCIPGVPVLTQDKRILLQKKKRLVGQASTSDLQQRGVGVIKAGRREWGSMVEVYGYNIEGRYILRETVTIQI